MCLFSFPDNVILDVCTFTDGNVFNGFFLKTIQSSECDKYMAGLPKPLVRRYVLPLKLPEDMVSVLSRLPGIYEYILYYKNIFT